MKRFECQSLREFLHPFQAALAATDTNAETIFHAGRSLCNPETSTGAVIKSEQCSRKVMNGTMRNNVSYFCGDFVHFQAGDKASQIMGVSPDITHHTRWTTANRIVLPCHPIGHRFRFSCF